MASRQDIKRRIRSVKGTRQITKAMQLVAASKLRRAQDAALAPQPYLEAAHKLLERLSGTAEVAAHPLYIRRTPKRVMAIVIAGERTLAGAYNSNVYRALGTLDREVGLPMEVISVGRQASIHLARVKTITEIAAYPLEVSDHYTEVVRPIIAEVRAAFESGQTDSVYLISTRFVTTVRQEVAVGQLIPIPALVGSTNSERELEPSPEILIETASERLLEAQLMQACLEAEASEQAARMLAMMNASDNADELIDDYTLAYNNARQAAITQELAEISAGSEAMAT